MNTGSNSSLAKKALGDELNTLLEKIEQTKKYLHSESNPDLKKMAEDELNELMEQKVAMENSVASLDGEPYEKNDSGHTGINPDVAIIEIRAGTGGDEAGLFAGDLYNMYTRFSEKRGWKVEEIVKSTGIPGEIRNATVEVKGTGAYSLLKNESGVHRVQRVPATESGGRIHTSTATVAVLPEVTPVEVEIDPKDLKLEFFHASGHGGQNVNKVQTGVRIYHTPTGVISESQEQRTQGQNRDKAMKILRSRLYEAMQSQQATKVNELRAGQIGTGERSEKIRTYNFPQDRVTDHRIKESFHNIPALLNGEIENLIAKVSSLNTAS